MNTDEIYQYFGSANKAAKAIGVTRAAFYLWMKRGYIPLFQQKKFETLTKGKLKSKPLDAKKTGKKEEKIYLPLFRYNDKKYGICEVESLQFRKGRPPKITCVSSRHKHEKFSTFNSENLMQATILKGKLIWKYLKK